MFFAIDRRQQPFEARLAGPVLVDAGPITVQEREVARNRADARRVEAIAHEGRIRIGREHKRVVVEQEFIDAPSAIAEPHLVRVHQPVAPERLWRQCRVANHLIRARSPR